MKVGTGAVSALTGWFVVFQANQAFPIKFDCLNPDTREAGYLSSNKLS